MIDGFRPASKGKRAYCCDTGTNPVVGAVEKRTKSLRAIFAATVAVLGISVASAQNYPSKYVRIVTPEAAGVSDVLARILAPQLMAAFGQPFVVENRGGASGLLAIQAVLKEPPNGETLLCYTNTFWIFPLMQSVPYDPVRDFVPITLAVTSPNILAVHPSLPVHSVKDLITLAKAHPGELNYSHGVNGATAHLAGELFKSMAGVKIVHIGYKGSGPAVTSLLSGEVQMTFMVPASGIAQIKSGRVRGLAVTSTVPSALAPGLPTVAASGLPGYETLTMTGFFAVAQTPTTIINRLYQEMAAYLNKPDVKAKLLNAGVEVAAATPDQFGAKIKSEMTKWSKIIKDAGIRVD